MKLLIAGGGTGGHVFPALAVAKCFTERTGDSGKINSRSVLFIGTDRGQERSLVPAHGYPILFIRVRARIWGCKPNNFLTAQKKIIIKHPLSTPWKKILMELRESFRQYQWSTKAIIIKIIDK
jgi:UDP-N-acetylglucosamine:LPS N-acetylglucosamine transferase